MTPRAEFLLLVSSFAQAASDRPWDVIQKAGEFKGCYGLLEDMALQFVAWQVHQAPEPPWWSPPAAQGPDLGQITAHCLDCGTVFNPHSMRCTKCGSSNVTELLTDPLPEDGESLADYRQRLSLPGVPPESTQLFWNAEASPPRWGMAKCPR